MKVVENLRRVKPLLDDIEERFMKDYISVSVARAEFIIHQIREGYEPAQIQPGFEAILRPLYEAYWRRAWEMGLQHAREEIQEQRFQEFPITDEDVWLIFLTQAGRLIRKEAETTKEIARQVIVEGMKAGKGMEEIAEDLRHRLGFHVGRARNIASTETMRCYSLGRWVSYRRTGVEFVRIDAVLDAFVCDFCASMDGKILRLREAEHGYFPPFHFQCRCVATPILPEEGEEIEHTPIETLPPNPLKEYGFGLPGTFPRIWEALRTRHFSDVSHMEVKT